MSCEQPNRTIDRVQGCRDSRLHVLPVPVMAIVE
jgi:hypothetical protein